MWCAMLNRPIAGPAPCVAANTKAIRPPTPATHMPAASAPARPSGRPSAPRRSRVARPPTAPMAAPADTPSSGGAHGQHRDGQGTQVEGVLADLADDHQDQDCVDHVHVDVHAVTVPRGTPPGRQPTGGSPG